jgi:hypothetical protein
MLANIPLIPSKGKLIIDRLDLRQIGAFSLAVTQTRPIRPRAGWLYVRFDLKDHQGTLSTSPILSGILSGGGRGVSPWLEGRLYPSVTFPDGVAIDARGLGLEAEIINLIGRAIPAGGHLMIDYEHEGQRETYVELTLGVPAAATYLGSLMFTAGFRGTFKDWYFSEGGHEGPRKLQANKSPDAASLRRATREHLEQLRAFIRRAAPHDRDQSAIVARAKARARSLIRELAHRASANRRLARAR